MSSSIDGVGLGAGKGHRRRLGAVCAAALAVCAGLAVSAGAAAPAGPTGSSLRVAAPGGQAGAKAVSTTTIFVITGSAAANSLTAWNDGAGRLVISSPQGILEPDGTKPDCIQDTPTQVSCRPGFIGAIAGDLGPGDDVFETQEPLTTPIGISLVSEQRPLSGGSGRDRISGGRGGDLLDGGAGDDEAFGLGGTDLLRGRGGRDTLSGGAAADSLFGGGGADKLSGGAARDRCNGGGGRDSAKSCNVTRKIP